MDAHQPDPRDPGLGRRLESAILDLLAQRRAGASICPSDAARAVHGDARGGGDDAPETEVDGWRVLMGPARHAARRLVAAGRVEVTQRGRVVDPADARGPIRIRAVRPGP